MTRDGVIVRDDSSWTSQFGSEVLNVVIIALLSTAISYQLLSIFYNIFFGCKSSGKATAHDIHKLMLAKASPPLEIFSALARIDVVDSLRCRGDFPKSVRIARRSKEVTTQVTLSLVIVLLAAPTFHLFSIFIVLPRDETITFREAKFAGMALGVGVLNQTSRRLNRLCIQGGNGTVLECLPDRSPLSLEELNAPSKNIWSGLTFKPFASDCDLITLRVVGPASNVAKFALCLEFELDLSQSLTDEWIRLTAETTFRGQIKVSVISIPSNTSVGIAASLDLTSQRKLFRMQPVLTWSDAAHLVHCEQERLALYCDSADPMHSPLTEDLLTAENSNGMIKVSKDFANCSLPSLRESIDVLFNLTAGINMIEHEHNNVVNIETLEPEAKSLPQYFGYGDLVFLAHRRRNVSLLGILLISENHRLERYIISSNE